MMNILVKIALWHMKIFIIKIFLKMIIAIKKTWKMIAKEKK